jgi:glycosyltransferase involved in cell wall biosynthesis
MNQRKKVVFVMDAMAHYRLAFFNMLREQLAAQGVDFQIVHGLNRTRHNIEGSIDWAKELPLKTLGPFSWLPALKETRDADLVVIPQVMKHLHLYPLVLRHLRRQQKIALWGHGKVFSRNSSSPSVSAFRYWVSRQAHWWFAYTEKSACVVREEIGFAPERITTVNNAVDTQSLIAARHALTPEQLRCARESLGIRSENVCIFVGGMYKTRHHDKRLPFLIEACVEIRRQIPDFEMIFIGGGPEAHVVHHAAAAHPWIHDLGIKKGIEPVPYWAISKLLLVPGAVGLVILDSLALEVPLVTTTDPCHGPEIEYLRSNHNGISLNDWQNPLAYAALVVSLLRDDATRLRLAAGCREDAPNYTNELMVKRFADGMLEALQADLCSVPLQASPAPSLAIEFPAPGPRAEVAMVFDSMSHYREAFFNLLRKRLAQEGIALNLIYGVGDKRHNIAGTLAWAHTRKLQTIATLSWLPVLEDTRRADLVILPQVMKQLHIYPHLWRGFRQNQKTAFFGHGKVFSASRPNYLAVKFKEFISRHCDWWFPYTERSARVVREEVGFPASQITVVNNAVDTVALTQAQKSLSSDQLTQLRAKLGISSGNVAIFVGGMYKNRHHTKRLIFLVASCLEIRKRIPDFEMIFVGGGPKQWVAEKAAAEHPWIHYVGVQKGIDAVPYWALAKVCLNPGLVGLGILDGFALGVPLITSDLPYHSPEIDYLKPGVNGLMIDDADDPRLFAEGAVALMQDDARCAAFAKAGHETVSLLTNEAMVENFTQGILKCLNLRGIVVS